MEDIYIVYQSIGAFRGSILAVFRDEFDAQLYVRDHPGTDYFKSWLYESYTESKAHEEALEAGGGVYELYR